MSPTLSGSSALQCIKLGDALEIRNGIFDFYPGLPHIPFQLITMGGFKGVCVNPFFGDQNTSFEGNTDRNLGCKLKYATLLGLHCANSVSISCNKHKNELSYKMIGERAQ